MSRKARVALVVVGVLVVGGGAAWGRQAYLGRCGAGSSLTGPAELAPRLVPIADARITDQLTQDLVAAADGLGAPFGDLVAVSWPEADAGLGAGPDAVLAAGPGIVLADGGGLLGSSFDATLTMVELPGGEPRWERRLSGYGLGGGTIGDLFVGTGTPDDEAPVVIAYALEDGRQVSCTRLGPDRETSYDPPFGTARLPDDDVVVMHQVDVDEDHTGLSLVRVDPATGEQAWSAEVATPAYVTDLHVLDDVVLQSTFTDEEDFPTALAMRASRDDAAASVVAYGTDGGAARWSLDEGDASALTRVAGVDPDAGVVVVTTARLVTGADGEQDVRRTFSALDVAGEVVWTRDAPTTGNGRAEVWDGALVQWNYGEEGVVRAWSTADGTDLWQTGPDDDGFHARDLDEARRVGDVWLVSEGAGMRVFDPLVGPGVLYPLPTPVWDVTVADEHLVLDSAGAVLVFERADVD